MDEVSKIALSPAELELLQNRSLLLTKQRLMQKAEAQLGALAAANVAISASMGLHPDHVWQKPPKISKGERYQDLPWLMLDYPRCFEAPEHMAIRTMLLWGTHVCTLLHVSGAAADYAMEVWFTNKQEKGWQAGYVSHPYQFEAGSQQLLNQPLRHSNGEYFARIIKYYPVAVINSLLPNLANDFSYLLGFLKSG